MNIEPEKFYLIAEVARLVRISPQCVHNWVHTGIKTDKDSCVRLHAENRGWRYVILGQDLINFLEATKK